jgi:hypothetical protein
MSGGKFLAHDARGAQLCAETDAGVPSVTAVSGSGTNFKVTFAVDGLKYPVYGFVSATGNDDLMGVLRAAEAGGALVHFRIESRRKASVPRDTPWSELDHKSQCRRLLVQAQGVWSTEVDGDWADDTGLGGPSPAATTAPVSAGPAPAQQPAPADLLARLEAFCSARPDLAAVAVAAAVAGSSVPVPALLGLLDAGRPATAALPARAPVPAAPSRTGARAHGHPGQGTLPVVEAGARLSPGYDDTGDADELHARAAASPAVTSSSADPSMEYLGKLVKLMRLAGLDAAEVASWVRRTYQVPSVQYLDTESLVDLLENYRVLGPSAGPARFAQDVRA